MSLLIEPDFGTPASDRTDSVTCDIDGISLVVPAQTSILRAASMAGISVVQAMPPIIRVGVDNCNTVLII